MTYFESIPAELPTNIFRSLEIEQYLEKTLQDNGFSLHHYKINFTKSVINIFLSVCKLKNKGCSHGQKISTDPLLTVKNEKLQKKYYLTTAALCKNSRLQSQSQTKKNLTNQIAKSLLLFTKRKQNINLTIKEINFVNAKFTRLTSNKTTKIHVALENFYKFRRAYFFKTGKRILIPATTHQNSAKLIGRFAAEHFVAVKQQNYFLNFLKESLLVLVKQKFSKIKGVKLVVTGRINNSARSQTRKIEIGNVSLISKSSQINYSESTAFTQNGTIGVKVWVSN